MIEKRQQKPIPIGHMLELHSKGFKTPVMKMLQ